MTSFCKDSKKNFLRRRVRRAKIRFRSLRRSICACVFFRPRPCRAAATAAGSAKTGGDNPAAATGAAAAPVLSERRRLAAGGLAMFTPLIPPVGAIMAPPPEDGADGGCDTNCGMGVGTLMPCAASCGTGRPAGGAATPGAYTTLCGWLVLLPLLLLVVAWSVTICRACAAPKSPKPSMFCSGETTDEDPVPDVALKSNVIPEASSLLGLSSKRYSANKSKSIS
mmetsp:Transcript_16820/g.27295  ORF Transcript_16820/g.27295 Transcript_16820/m.27295 type:complete len:224 (-) Transcript_16820:226-897(-)